MSLFIGALAFPGETGAIDAAKIGTLAGSLLSAVAGYAVLRWTRGEADPDEDRAEADALFAGDEG
jgi:NhaA family Na+:H+ antiporter